VFIRIAAFLAGVILFAGVVYTVPVLASLNNHGLEQEINLIDTTVTFNSAVPSPADNSLGIINWDPGKYSQFSHARLEILGKTELPTSQIIAALYDTGGNIVAQSKATIGNANKITTLDGCPECDKNLDTIYTSEVLDVQGNPIVVYISQIIGSGFGTGDGDLKLVHCGNADCSSGNTVVNVDGCVTCQNNIDIGKHSSILLNSVGNPVITYEDESNGYLRIVVCGNADCSTGNTYSVVDDGCSVGGVGCHSVGTYASMQLDSAGKPVIIYFDTTTDDLRFVHCGDPVCSANNIYKVLDGCDTCFVTGQSSNSSTGQYGSLKLDSLGFPVVSYRDGAPNHNLKFLHCKDANCTNVVYNMIDNGTSKLDSSGIYTSMQFDSNGFPVISFGRGDFSGGNLHLKLAHCNDVDCFSSSVVILDGLDNGFNCGSSMNNPGACDIGDVGWYNKLQLDQNGNPTISYRSAVAGDLKVVHCNDVGCTGNDESMIRVDGCTGCDEDGDSPISGAGGYISLQIDIFGNPVISYRQVGPNSGHNNLKVVHCGNADCNPTGPGQVDPTNYQLVFSSEFNPGLLGNFGPRDFTLRAWTIGGNGYIRSAKLILSQSSDSPITATETQVEIGNSEISTNSAYMPLEGSKIVGYNALAYDPVPTTFFEATLKLDPTIFSSNPKTAIATAGTAKGNKWNAVNYTVKSDNLYANSKSKTQDYLILSNFGFNIPNGATVVGITIEREGKSAGIKQTTRQYRMSLSKDGGNSIAGSEKAALDLPYNVDNLVFVGGGNDLWGTTFSSQEINSPNFSVLLRSNNRMGARISFDLIRVQVFYEDVVKPEVFAALYSTDDQLVAGSEVSTSSLDWVRMRSPVINLISGKDYLVKIKTSGGAGKIANAKLVFDQSGTEIAKLSLTKLLINSPTLDNSGSFSEMGYLEKINEQSYSGYVIGKYLDATAKNTNSSSQLRLFDIAQNTPLSSSVITINSSLLTRFTSNLITESVFPGSLLDLQSQSDGGSISNVSSASLILNLVK